MSAKLVFRSWKCAAVATAIVGLTTMAGFAAAEPVDRNSMPALINQIAGVDQAIANLNLGLAEKRGIASQALVDLQNARAQQRIATAAVTANQNSLTASNAQVNQAQSKFNDFVRAIYKSGNQKQSLVSVITGNPEEALNKASVVDQLTRDQRATVNQLVIARNKQVNKVSVSKSSAQLATHATDLAAVKQSDAQKAVSAATEAVRNETVKRNQLTSQRQKILDLLNIQRKEVGLEVILGQPKLAAAQPNSTGVQIPASVDSLAVAAEAVKNLLGNDFQRQAAEMIARVQTNPAELLNNIPGFADTTKALTLPQIPSLSQIPGMLGLNIPVPGIPGLRGPAGVEVIVNRALSQLGVTYAWGGGDGNGPTLGIRDGGVADSYGDFNKIGFDCSGLMIFAFAGVGISLPHYTGYQYTSGPQVPLSQIQRGDMIFYGSNASAHVALALGNNQMVEAPESGSVVKISPLRTAGAMPYVVRLM